MGCAGLTFFDESAPLLVRIIVRLLSLRYSITLLLLWYDRTSVWYRCPRHQLHASVGLCGVRQSLRLGFTVALLLFASLKPWLVWVARCALVVLIQKLERHWVVVLIFQLFVSWCRGHQVRQVAYALLLEPCFIPRARRIARLRILVFILHLSWSCYRSLPIVCLFLKFLE